MLIDAVIKVVAGVISSVLVGLGTIVPEPPQWVFDGLSIVGWLVDQAQAFDTWLPVDVALSVIGWVLAVNVTVALMKLARVVISYVTFGGGAVAD
ncbi:MAG TPA: hypothetical protein VFQ37_16675 [Mycobacterium sp.]|nr:hypothetical protein [Mycobacterium sp.]